MISRIFLGKPSFFLSILLASVCSFSLVRCSLLNSAVGLGMMKLQFGCLPEGTLVDGPDGPDGPVPVEELRTGDRVIGYDGEAVVIRQVHQYQENAAEGRHLKVGI
jgi:hypothetical protein